jgi:hypothetical protein
VSTTALRSVLAAPDYSCLNEQCRRQITLKGYGAIGNGGVAETRPPLPLIFFLITALDVRHTRAGTVQS